MKEGCATITRSDGAKRAASDAQLASSEAGATRRLGAGSPPADRSVNKQGEDLNGLAEPHVVGEAGAETEPGQKGEPTHADLLVGS